MPKKATIDDVAVRAGVSIKTVSRVANNEPNVRESTRAKVNEAIKALNYLPNLAARNLASRRSYLIGLIYDDQSVYDIPSSGYIINIQNGVLRACKAQNFDLLIHPCDYRSKSVGDEISALIDHSRLDGVVIAPPLSDVSAIIEAIDKAGKPFARIAPAGKTNRQSAVRTNDRQICAEMTRYLASLGHEKIAFITGHADHKAVAARFLGFQDGLQASGLKMYKSLVKQGDNSIKSGEECGEKLLRSNSPPTAIFACNDDMAAGVLRVAHRLEIAVPEQLSIAGFDDVPLAQQVYPALTTINQPLAAMATRAAEMLIDRLRTDAPDNASEVIQSRLIIRESTGPAPAQHS
jgi:LacI family transcriptional regulator